MLTRCCIPQSLGRSFTEALSHCTMLTNLLLGGNHLRNCVADLFSGPGFQFLYQLSLHYTGLSKEDIGSLSAAVRDGKLPRLGALNLSLNAFTDCVADLFDHPGFQSIDTLDLNNTKLNATDLKSLSQAVTEGKLSSLENLILSDNVLAGFMGQLLSSNLLSLVELKLKNAELGGDDITDISKAVREGKLPNLETLQLSGNILTNHLGKLLDADYPSLKQLKINETELNKTDLEYLAEAISEGKLPKLCCFNQPDDIFEESKKADAQLDGKDESVGWQPYTPQKLAKLCLKGNNLSAMEAEVENLIRTCVPSCEYLELKLSDKNLSDELCERIKIICQESKISLDTN